MRPSQSLVFGALAMALVAFSAGCPGEHDHNAAPPEQTDHSHAQEGHESRLRLNAGKKWAMDEHTRAVFAKLRDAVSGESPASLQEVSALANSLDGHLKELVAGCTMTGEAHDQLHIFLTSFMPSVEAFAKESDLAKAREMHQGLQTAIIEYDRFFE